VTKLLSSFNRPRRKCSLSIVRPPNWLLASEENHASRLFRISFESHYLRWLSLLYPFVRMVAINKQKAFLALLSACSS
jgi:hypothetical protein